MYFNIITKIKKNIPCKIVSAHNKLYFFMYFNIITKIKKLLEYL
jgi:hypothetical protein